MKKIIFVVSAEQIMRKPKCSAKVLKIQTYELEASNRYCEQQGAVQTKLRQGLSEHSGSH